MKRNAIYPPSPQLSSAHIASLKEYEKCYDQSLQDNDTYWEKQALQISWKEPFHTVSACDFSKANIAWFLGGKLNASHNCIDRHIENGLANQTAIIWAKDEVGQYEHITYQQMHDQVCKIANTLKYHGVGKGDRVCIYMPMVPQATYAMLACSRIGAVHSVVFAGFSADALRDRINDAQTKVVLTANEGLRGGKTIKLKSIVDQALEGTDIVESVLVLQKTKTTVPMIEGRDFDLQSEMDQQPTHCEIQWMDAEDPLFILYTSGSTGKPKGLVHTTGGYLVYTSSTHRYVFDYQPGDVYFCAADIGWITGHSYIVYGPLANGATTVMFESTPMYPDAGRYWRVIEDLQVHSFYTAPTALRAIAPHSEDLLGKHNLSSLKILGSVGEPIDADTWRWYYEKVGRGQCSVVDTWWQTETGGILISPLPGATPTKPGSATKPMFGIEPQIIDEQGNIIEGSGKGALVMARSWPGQARTIYKDHARFLNTYFSQYPGYYFSGDGAQRDEDGYIWISGRMDDVINVAGHRLGTAEIEGALIEHEEISEAAVIGIPHPIKGTSIYSFVVIDRDFQDLDHEHYEKIIRQQVQNTIGSFAKPDIVQVTQALPKTRSGKVMRRILRKIAQNDLDHLGDTSTLANPECMDTLITQRKNK